MIPKSFIHCFRNGKRKFLIDQHNLVGLINTDFICNSNSDLWVIQNFEKIMVRDVYMRKKEDKNTRYFIDLDLKTRKIVYWDYDQRHTLAGQKLTNPFYHRIFLTKGQYNKLEKKHSELLNKTA